jgi:NAD(P)-dependent dehydrogenase (short-subunit alcohol dehydrogenase family)
MEGNFIFSRKTDIRTYDMAKAALNMLTHTLPLLEFGREDGL